MLILDGSQLLAEFKSVGIVRLQFESAGHGLPSFLKARLRCQRGRKRNPCLSVARRNLYGQPKLFFSRGIFAGLEFEVSKRVMRKNEFRAGCDCLFERDTFARAIAQVAQYKG